jgi:hypothetical protein
MVNLQQISGRPGITASASVGLKVCVQQFRHDGEFTANELAFTVKQETGHVKIVDRLVRKDAARDRNVFIQRSAWTRPIRPASIDPTLT